ncbi:toll/interleukin-1 receptor domain-containing protein [Streptomyces sp. S3(2020)]|uniref:toll/interleukin-1 receptor domain-containing protein n=1 Tax=Streptomyces sp. S3(2020) TaxID=2732044 RepID=UPI001487A58D|nr:toll/interleukin-1 receptor domain-containing protein [Streptomyces sp. S3(2020)]NNN38140.1 toll/interleukin-1 receptor domain-containing protein [Streptomyces sp. S3(2020)]
MAVPVPDVRVLISYSHDGDAHRKTVLNLANRLRQAGIDAWIDQFEEHEPPESWPDWMRRELDRADFVLVVVTKVYLERFNRESEAGVGSGVRWEGALITAGLYHGRRYKARYLPVVLREEDRRLVPVPLNLTTSYVVGETGDGDLAPLLRVLRGSPNAVPVTLGSLPEDAARDWQVDLYLGNVREVWRRLDPDLRLALAQDWVLANSGHPEVRGHDRDELADALAEERAGHPLAGALLEGRVAVLREHYAAVNPASWGPVANPRRIGVDHAIVEMGSSSGGGSPSPERSLLMRKVGRAWLVANFRAAYVIPGWPPRQEEIPGALRNGGT